MVSIDRHRLEEQLRRRGENLSAFARRCGISRQSLYLLFEGKSVFSVPFEKILRELGADFRDLIAEMPDLAVILGDAPESVRRAALELEAYAEKQGADLFLIGSRARGAKGVRSDWDFAVFFPDRKARNDLAALKLRLADVAFPHRVEVVDLTVAPSWFLRSVAIDAVRMSGATPCERIFGAGGEKRRVA